MLSTADVLEALGTDRPDWAIHNIYQAVIDSRKASHGSLFVAVPGENLDGHDFIDNAFANGAISALVEKEIPSKYNVLDLRRGSELDISTRIEIPFCIRVENSIEALQRIARFWRKKLNPRVIGITGSVGKSTTKEVSAEVLNQKYRTLKNPGNLNNEIGLPLTILSLSDEHQIAVLEMGFYVPGEIKFLCDIAKPQVGMITNIGTVHAERAGSQEAIALGKSELVQALPTAPQGVAVLNYDDPLVKAMSSKTEARVFYYGLDSRADLWADHIEGLGLDGIRLRLHYQNEQHYLRVPLIGRHSVHTVLRATALGLIEGLTWQDIVSGLRTGRAQLRLVAVRGQNGALILDDTYNASPESTIAALNLLGELDGNKIAVLGDMLELGQYEYAGHRMVGGRAAEVVDELIVVGEKATTIAATAQESGFNPSKTSEFENSQQVIDFLCGRLEPNDVVLVKGSNAMNMDQIVSALEKVE